MLIGPSERCLKANRGPPDFTPCLTSNNDTDLFFVARVLLAVSVTSPAYVSVPLLGSGAPCLPAAAYRESQSSFCLLLQLPMFAEPTPPSLSVTCRYNR